MNTTVQLSSIKQPNPFGSQGGAMQPTGGGALAASDQGRAIAEVQAAMIIARQSPRNQISVMDKIINACTRPSLAESAVYQYSRGGSDISGPSIRLAEAIAQQWGNIKFGFDELSRGMDHDGVTYSEVGAYAWDLETNSRKQMQFRVRHWRDRKNGNGYQLKDERDIYELMANQAQRRVRACILSVIPGDVTEAAVKQCELTLKATADTSPEGIKKLIEAFDVFGVTKNHIEMRIQRKIESIQPAQIVNLKKVYSSLRDGMGSVSDFFEIDSANIDSLKKKSSDGDDQPIVTKEPKKTQRDKPDIKPEEIQSVNSFVPSAEEREPIQKREIAEASDGYDLQ